MADPNRILVVNDFFLRTEAESEEEVIFLDRLLNLADAAFSAKERSSNSYRHARSSCADWHKPKEMIRKC